MILYIINTIIIMITIFTTITRIKDNTIITILN